MVKNAIEDNLLIERDGHANDRTWQYFQLISQITSQCWEIQRQIQSRSLQSDRHEIMHIHRTIIKLIVVVNRPTVIEHPVNKHFTVW